MKFYLEFKDFFVKFSLDLLFLVFEVIENVVMEEIVMGGEEFVVVELENMKFIGEVEVIVLF